MQLSGDSPTISTWRGVVGWRTGGVATVALRRAVKLFESRPERNSPRVTEGASRASRANRVSNRSYRLLPGALGWRVSLDFTVCEFINFDHVVWTATG